jgi:hypothetical protein
LQYDIKIKLPDMRGSFTENVWQPCIQKRETALTLSFATLAFTSLRYGTFRC